MIFVVLIVIYQFLLNSFLAAAPVMENPPQNVTVLDGKDAIMACNAVGAPTPNVTWYYHGKIFFFNKSPIIKKFFIQTANHSRC